MLIIGLNEPNLEIVIAFVTVRENWDTRKKSRKPTIIGGILLSSTSYNETLIGEKIAGLQWMNNHSKESEVSFLLD